MSHERAKRLSPLIRIAEQSVQEALAYIGKIQLRMEDEKERRASLQLYQKEYQASFNHTGKQGISGAQIQQFEAFMQQIDSALLNQQKQIQQIHAQLEQARKVYIQLNTRLKSYKKLKNRLTDQAITSENQQLQKLLDELGALAHRRHSN